MKSGNSKPINNYDTTTRTAPMQNRNALPAASPPPVAAASSTTTTAATTTTTNTTNHQRQSYNTSEFDVVTERRYGCYRLGIAAAVLIIIILIAGTVPVVIAIKDSQIILIVTCLTLVFVAILVFVYIGWQHRTVRQQREKFGREWVTTTNRHNAQYSSVPSSTHTSWLFWGGTPKHTNHGHRLVSPTTKSRQQSTLVGRAKSPVPCPAQRQ